MRHTTFLFALFSILTLCSISADREMSFAERKNFIEDYKDLAIQEMHRTGIPAAITLAQFILESDWGRGELFTEANAGFGIKCKTTWNGETHYVEDDDYKNNKLIESCFRKYDTVADGFTDHSDFLKNRSYYQPLFLIDRHDYKGWAYGLKDCKYATDPKYPAKLIRLIETYGLHLYDYEVENAQTEEVLPTKVESGNIGSPVFQPEISRPVVRPNVAESVIIVATELIIPSYDNVQIAPNPLKITPIMKRKKRRARYKITPGHRRPVAVYAP